jgi:Mrp family chromosome partitioning ATPase
VVPEPTSLEGLDVVTAGLPTGRPADVVAMHLPAAISTVRTTHAPVLVDMPPIAGVAESGSIIAATHWVILVTGSSARDLQNLPLALGEVRDSGGELLGVVVNRVSRRKLRRANYYGYGDARQPVVAAAPTELPRPVAV